MARVEAHERALCRLAMDALERISGRLPLRAAQCRAQARVAFNVEGIHPHDGAALLESGGSACGRGIIARSPSSRLGIVGTLRASFSSTIPPRDRSA